MGKQSRTPVLLVRLPPNRSDWSKIAALECKFGICAKIDHLIIVTASSTLEFRSDRRTPCRRISRRINDEANVVTQSHNISLLIHHNDLQIIPAILDGLGLQSCEQELDAFLRQRFLDIQIQKQCRVPKANLLNVFLPTLLDSLWVILIFTVQDEGLADLREHVDQKPELLVRPSLAGVPKTHPLIVDVPRKLAISRKPRPNLTGGFTKFGIGPLNHFHPGGVFTLLEGGCRGA